MSAREIAQQRVELHLERHFERKVWHRAATRHRANRFFPFFYLFIFFFFHFKKSRLSNS